MTCRISQCLPRFLAALLIALVTLAASDTRAEKVTVEKSNDGAKVLIDGELFTEYLTKSGTKPVLWPILGPDGQKLTRSFPMAEKQPEEKADHPHHRSLWFTHGEVNDSNFWHEGKDTDSIEHQEFVTLESGETGTIVTRNDWVTNSGQKVCEDVRHLTFGENKFGRYIDFDITIKATAGDVTFRDTKEGSFGIRVPGSMKVTSKPGGEIVNSHGDKDQDAWGKSSPWVDYHGPVDGETLGIAILNHPSSFRFPTYWHVRTYGLFAANPFGLKAFTKKENGAYTIPSGESISLRYRVLFHEGDEKQGRIAEAFETYKKVDKE